MNFIFCDLCIPPGLIHLVLFEVKRKMIVQANSWLKHQLYFRDIFFLFDSLLLFVIYWFDETDLVEDLFCIYFQKLSQLFKVNCIYFFPGNPWPWEIVKFEKNWGQICYCVLTPSIATSSFLTAWKLVFFPGGPGPNFHMVQAFYGVSLLCVPPRSGKLLKSAIWVGIAKDYTLAVLFCCEKSA